VSEEAPSFFARFVSTEDPVCVTGPSRGPCGGCHWCLRAQFGPTYWLGPDPTDATIEAAIEILKRPARRKR